MTTDKFQVEEYPAPRMRSTCWQRDGLRSTVPLSDVGQHLASTVLCQGLGRPSGENSRGEGD